MSTFPANPPTCLSEDGKTDLGPHTWPPALRAPANPGPCYEQDFFTPDADFAGTLPLDVLPGAACAYSYRKLRTAYAGAAAKVRRDSDSVLLDVGFLANGDWDIPTYHDWLAASVPGDFAYTQTWYDQSGNGNHMTQPLAALQAIPHAPDYPANNITGTDGQGISNRFYTTPDVATVQGIWDAGGFVIAAIENTAGVENPVLAKGINPNGWQLFCYHTGDTPETDQLYFYWVGTGGTGPSSYFTSSTAKFTRGPKRHVISCAWNKGNPGQPAGITIDGVSSGTNFQVGTAMSSEAGPLQAINENVIQANNTAINGRVYELMAWKQRPSPSVITALHENLLAYYGN